MAKFGYYKQSSMGKPSLIQEIEGTDTRIDGLHSITICRDGEDVATFHLAEGEWVARVDAVSAPRAIA